MITMLGLVACQNANQREKNVIAIEQFQSASSIKDYLQTKVASVGFGGKPYCAYEVLAAEPVSDNINLYLWALCQEYYLDKQTLQQGTGSSFPIALTIEQTNSAFNVLSHQVPSDGASYTEDINTIFPEKFRQEISPESANTQNQRVNRLLDETKREAGAS
jgi:hypothetical protein